MKCFGTATGIRNQRELKCQTRITNDTSSEHCPVAWDGFICWNRTLSGTIATEPCPPEFSNNKFSQEQFVTKYCTADGEWFVNHFGTQWANYSGCVSDQSFDYEFALSVLGFVGYAISFVALIIAFTMFAFIRAVRCERTYIHQNLVLSFAAACVSQSIWLYIATNTAILRQNPTWCQLIHVLMIYCLLSTYSWMFCEGCYLHTILLWTNLSEHKLYYWLCLFGWGAPAIPLAVYVYLRTTCFQIPQQLNYCWILVVSDFWWIYGSFTIALLLVNVLFLLNIVRMVFMKAQPTIQADGVMSALTPQLRATVKALVILFPILGIQYILSSIHQRHSPGSRWTIAYELFYTLFTAFQGLAVAIAVCFINSEVQSGVRRKWQRYKNRLSRQQNLSVIESLTSSRLFRISTRIRRRSKPNKSKEQENQSVTSEPETTPRQEDNAGLTLFESTV